MCKDMYAYDCAVGHENGLASGYTNSYSYGYNHTTALISNNDDLQGNNSNWDLDQKPTMTTTTTIIIATTNDELIVV